MDVGYARVSTGDQNMDLQRDALEEAGCERLSIFSTTLYRYASDGLPADMPISL
jgi:DNA invertase Pin-like site-specific DNA recombinase